MLCAAAVVPHPPLLVPELGGTGDGVLDDLRAACDTAVAGLLASGPDRVVVVGAGERTRVHPSGSRGSLRPYGAPVDVVLGGTPSGGPAPGTAGALPLALGIGAWLLARSGARVATSGLEVSPSAGSAECAALGRELVEDGRVGLLVCGDGSARCSPTSPRSPDERAGPFGDAVRAALAAADASALLAVDPDLSAQLVAAGRPAWQVLAGAAQGSRYDAELLASTAAYGVAYSVAVWRALA